MEHVTCKKLYFKKIIQANRNCAYALRLFIAILDLIISFACWGGDANNAPVTTVPVSKPGGWLRKHEGFVAQAKKGDIPLVFLGDSITEYWGVAGKAVWQKTYDGLKAANFGIAADRVENVLWRVQNGEFDGIEPKVVVLLVGINNCWACNRQERNQRGQDIALGIKAIIAGIQQKSPPSKILLLAIFPGGEGLSPPAMHANTALVKLDDGKTIRLLDIGPKLSDKDGIVSKEIMPDGLHLSEKGYELWAEAMAPLLKEMLGN